jgi:DNA polymerase V
VAYQRIKLSTNLDSIHEFELPALIVQSVSLPLYSSKASSGLPSPAEEHIEKMTRSK